MDNILNDKPGKIIQRLDYSWVLAKARSHLLRWLGKMGRKGMDLRGFLSFTIHYPQPLLACLTNVLAGKLMNLIRAGICKPARLARKRIVKPGFFHRSWLFRFFYQELLKKDF